MDNKELLGYIQRAIPDIARKCGMANTDVVKAMYQYSSNLLLDGSNVDK